MDTIANMLTTLLNAQRVGKTRAAVPYSRFKESLARLLHEQKMIASVRVQEGPQAKLILTLAYDDAGNPRIRGAKRLSRPGRRVYVTSSEIPYPIDTQGAVILSTSQGLMSGTVARQHSVGGELICEIW